MVNCVQTKVTVNKIHLDCVQIKVTVTNQGHYIQKVKCTNQGHCILQTKVFENKKVCKNPRLITKIKTKVNYLKPRSLCSKMERSLCTWNQGNNTSFYKPRLLCTNQGHYVQNPRLLTKKG